MILCRKAEAFKSPKTESATVRIVSFFRDFQPSLPRIAGRWPRTDGGRTYYYYYELCIIIIMTEWWRRAGKRRKTYCDENIKKKKKKRKISPGNYAYAFMYLCTYIIIIIIIIIIGNTHQMRIVTDKRNACIERRFNDDYAGAGEQLLIIEYIARWTGSHGQRCRIHRHFWWAARRRTCPAVDFVAAAVVLHAVAAAAAAPVVVLVGRHRSVFFVRWQIVFPATRPETALT